MRHPQLLIYENEGHIAALLRETARALKWAFREPRQPEACLRLLGQGGPSVLVIHVRTEQPREPGKGRARDVGHELALLERAAWLFSDTKTVLVCDRETEAAGLGWDLGADFVLGPSAPRDQLPGIVVGLMEAVAGHLTEVVAEG